MGSCLSPFIAEILIKIFETNLMISPTFPRIWLRYVDDVFAITKKSKVDGTLQWLNSQLQFDVYQKSTSTRRYITVDSFHPQHHRNAAFHSMTHRFCNFELTPEKYEREKATIIGRVNGYAAYNISKIISNHERRRTSQHNNIVTIEVKKHQKRISIPFYPGITNKIQKVCKRNDIGLVTSSSGYRLKDKLESTKNTVLTNNKSGIYEIQCGMSNNDYRYIGQTRRFILT
jgi:hypothetical protein